MSHVPKIMGVLNVTPDSFSDGGQNESLENAVEAAKRMVDAGADLLDVGGESTRPGSDSVSESIELQRVIPVIRAVVPLGIPISIDTTKPEVARQAISEGAAVLNDIQALQSDAMLKIAVDTGVTVCLMHMQGAPKSMQVAPTYANVVEEVRTFLTTQAGKAMEAGVSEDKIWIDPGIGFGKSTDHNLALLNQLHRLKSTGFPVLVGASRKAFLGRLLGTEKEPLPVLEREEATLAVSVWAALSGASIIRVHNVLATKRAFTTLHAIQRADGFR
jgi:dihydropteroate synthase